jgi:hypothetical protein
MATSAQIAANRENAKHSTGPTSDGGLEISSRNRTTHGLTGHVFFLLENEDPAEFEELHQALKREHEPKTATELILVEKMAQAHWLSQRAQSMQTCILAVNPFDDDSIQRASVYFRYQTQQDRAFQRALKDLLNLRAERRKAEIGFESQKHKQAEETRKAETHKLKTVLLECKLHSAQARVPPRKPAPQSPVAGPEAVRVAQSWQDPNFTNSVAQQ